MTSYLKIYAGIIQPIKNITPDTITLDIVDASTLKYKNIPQTVIDEDDYPLAPEETLGKYLPVVYGDFNFNDELRGALAEAEWISPEKVSFDHVLKSVDSVWIYDARRFR